MNVRGWHNIERPIYVNMSDNIIPVEAVKEITPGLWLESTKRGKHIAPLIFHIWTTGPNGRPRLEVVGWPLSNPHSKLFGLQAARTYCHEYKATAMTVMWEAWVAQQEVGVKDSRLPSERADHERKEHVILNVHQMGQPMETYWWPIRRLANRADLGPREDLGKIMGKHSLASHWLNILPDPFLH